MKKTLVVLFALAILIFAVACSSSPEKKKTGYLKIDMGQYNAGGYTVTEIKLIINGSFYKNLSIADCQAKKPVLVELMPGEYENVKIELHKAEGLFFTSTMNKSSIVIVEGQTTECTAIFST